MKLISEYLSTKINQKPIYKKVAGKIIEDIFYWSSDQEEYNLALPLISKWCEENNIETIDNLYNVADKNTCNRFREYFGYDEIYIRSQGYDLSEKAVKISDKEIENCIDKVKSNPDMWKEYVLFGYTENMAFVSVYDGIDNANIYCWKEKPKTKV